MEIAEDEVAGDEPGEADAIGVEDAAGFGGDVVGLFGGAEGRAVEVAEELRGGELWALTRVTGPSASKAMARNETIDFIRLFLFTLFRLSRGLSGTRTLSA